ncbi:MAG: bifunctional 5,10-methylenetetrahydrofolate dehydrogenase/5,10-methenyltetrahydrofolate cyclohydrolase [bacterium JZ-2024 1]
MTATVVFNGKEKAADLEKHLVSAFGTLPAPPVVYDFGDLGNPEVRAYVEARRKRGERLGVSVQVRDVSQMESAEQFYQALQEASYDPSVTAIWVDRPLPFVTDEDRIFRIMPATKDGEGVHPENLGRLMRGEERIVPATARAVITALDTSGFVYPGANAVVLGRSLIVGRPVALLLLHRHCTVTICHSRSRDLPEKLRTADLVVVAIGKAGFVHARMLREGAYVVDVGTNYVNGKLVGDVHPEGLTGKVAWLTPVPGGIGPLTSVLAFDNILRLSQEMKGMQ